MEIREDTQAAALCLIAKNRAEVSIFVFSHSIFINFSAPLKYFL